MLPCSAMTLALVVDQSTMSGSMYALLSYSAMGTGDILFQCRKIWMLCLQIFFSSATPSCHCFACFSPCMWLCYSHCFQRTELLSVTGYIPVLKSPIKYEPKPLKCNFWCQPYRISCIIHNLYQFLYSLFELSCFHPVLKEYKELVNRFLKFFFLTHCKISLLMLKQNPVFIFFLLILTRF